MIPIERLNAKERKELEEKVASVKKVLEYWVHESRGFQPIGVDRLVFKEFDLAMVFTSLSLWWIAYLL
jgi:hypothetical protein